MPAKNSSRFLGKTLESILGQTETNWELIAVNDGSEDDTSAIISEYAESDRRIKLYGNEEGSGIIPALRTSLKHSRGEYITRMDSDDIMVPHKLETMKKLLEERGRGYVATGMIECFSDDGIKDGYRKYEKWLNEVILSENPYNEIYKECVIQSSCWMAHRNDLLKAGAFEPDDYPEDYDLCFRFFKHGIMPVVDKHSGILHYWRDHSARVSRNNPEYADQQFFDLKLKYFFELERDNSRELVLWGAGAKGKKLARKILAKYADSFRWITDNPKKIGETIYGIKVESPKVVSVHGNFQVVIAVSAPEESRDIEKKLQSIGMKNNRDCYNFC